MARRARRLEAGGIYHVHNRGALRQSLFAAPVDCRLFLGSLRDALERHPVALLSWCVMPNHWHLLVRPKGEAALPAFMRWLTLAHSRRWQALHGEPAIGTLYGGRYRSTVVEGDEHLLTVVRYIERNPVRAGLSPSCAAWPWSSARARLVGSPALLAPLPVALPEDWLAWMNTPQTAAELDACRRPPVRDSARATELQQSGLVKSW
jgi:putative transposase